MIKNNVQIFDLLNQTKKGKESNIIFRQKGRSSNARTTNNNKKPTKGSNQGITLNFYMGNGGLTTRPHVGWDNNIPKIEELQALNLNNAENINNKLDEMLRRPQADNTELSNQIRQLYQQQSRINRQLPEMMNQIQISNLQSGIGLMANLNRNKGRPGRGETSVENLESMRNRSIVEGLDALESMNQLNDYSKEIRDNLRKRCDDENQPGCIQGFLGSRNSNQIVPVSQSNMPERSSGTGAATNTPAPQMSSSILFQDSVSSNNNIGFGGVPRTLVFKDPVPPVRNSMDDEYDALIADSGIEIIDLEAGPRM